MMPRLLRRLQSICGARMLLDTSFLIVQFLPLPGALHPKFADVHARETYCALGGNCIVLS